MKKSLSVKYEEYTTLQGSRQLLVRQVGDGSIIKRFDKTLLPQQPQDIVCPHFLELKWAYGCPYKCAWCYLQGTLRLLPTRTKPVVKDYKKIENHIEAFFDETVNNGYTPEILNCGEIADSLMWENNGSPFSRFVISLFDTQEKHKILFLSKSDRIENIIQLESDRLIPSFTLNAYAVASQWECGAPAVKRRIEAAKDLVERGYPVRIRIDPLVPISNWKKEYVGLVDDVFSQFEPERITLGSLRGLVSTINNARDRTWVEFLSEHSNWGKKVHFRTRYLMYSTIIYHLKSNYEYDDIALCKETKEMWEDLSMNYKGIRCNCTW